MRTSRVFEKYDFCPACRKGVVNLLHREGRVYCSQSGCGFETTTTELSTSDYEQITIKLMVIFKQGL